MPTYRIKSDECELPKGSRVYVIPGEVQPGQLVMFELKGDPDFLITGRWHPNIAGCNWITQPKRVIRDTDAVPVRIIGVVVPVEAPPKEITNLTAEEHITALLCAGEVMG